MQLFSSKDFGRTENKIRVSLPEKLLHKNVEEVALDGKFSSERRHPVFVVDLPSKTLSVTIGLLAPKESTRRHRHTYETILYVLEGQGRTIVEDRVVEWQAGDAVYIPVWAWHHHENLGTETARYIACENAPLLQNIAGVAIREEG